MASEYDIPLEKDYDCFRSDGNPSRVVVFCKKSLKITNIDYTGELPAVILESSQCSFGFVYGEFTALPYSGLSHPMMDKQRCTRLLDFLDLVHLKAKKNCFIAGDFGNQKIPLKKRFQLGVQIMVLFKL